MRTFTEILTELGQALDFALNGKVTINSSGTSSSPTIIEPIKSPTVVTTTTFTNNLYTGEIEKTSVIKEIIDLGVTANGGKYKVVVFDDGLMRVYQSVVGGYKQVSENSADTPKSAMYGYLANGFLQQNIDKVLWNVIATKIFSKEIK